VFQVDLWGINCKAHLDSQIIIKEVHPLTQQMFIEKNTGSPCADVTVPHKEKRERFIGVQSLVAQGMFHVEFGG
jgi:hypothetical protein